MNAFDHLSREELIAIILQQQEQIAALTARVAELERQLSGKGGPPAWVKPNVALANKKAKEQERKKRAQSFVRKREPPTEVIYHAEACCRDCGHALSGGWVHSRRQVIEVPRTPIRVIDHVFVGRHCGVCRKRCLPPCALGSEVVGQHRLGIGLMSLIGCLRSVYRLPIRSIQSLLRVLYGLSISAGEIVEIGHKIAKQGEPVLKDLQNQVRGSPYIHADETGWREDGQNGYIWVFATPSVRYFHYDRSRGGSVPREVLSDQFGGVVVSDFYGAYNGVSGGNQRCWVHLLRDLHKLTEAHPDNVSLQEWAQQIVTLYREAIDYQQACRHAQASSSVAFGYNSLQRRDQRRKFESRLAWLALPYLEKKKGTEADPRAVLAQRLDRYAAELFVFIEHPDIPAENNAAERALRPHVIARKISGGTRSDKGSRTRTALMSLFATWQAQAKDPWIACREMLAATMPSEAI